MQSSRPHPESGRHYYFRPKAKGTGEELSLTAATIRQHLEGEITIGLYAINPATQQSKWAAIDADYAGAMEHLLKLQYSLQQDEGEAALEMSKRGGHLWIFMERPAFARDYEYFLILRDQRFGPWQHCFWHVHARTCDAVPSSGKSEDAAWDRLYRERGKTTLNPTTLSR